ncbi:MAG: hypothetical protein ABIT96_10350 [Ferruginibacter sp.]
MPYLSSIDLSTKYLTALLCTLIFLYSCKKEDNSNSFQPFYHLKVNNNLKKIYACGTSDYVAAYLRDTAVYAAFGCGGESAGFYLKGQIADGTYILGNKNIAFYATGATSYQTDSLNKGTLTIRSGTFVLANGIVPMVEGEFSFDAIDKNTGQIIKVTSGKYRLEKR